MSNTKPAKEIYEWINEKTDVEILSHSKYDNIPTPNYTFNGKGRGADLIIRASQYNYAIITKDNSSSDTVHDGATHLARYWQDYHNSAVKYVHEDDHIEIDVFLLATQDSENGHLFKSNREKKLERKSNHVEVTAGGEPPLSSTRSTTIFRVLYRFIDEFFDEVSPGVGILVSSKLEGKSWDDTQLTDTPYGTRVHYYRTGDGIDFKEIK